jgi:hypothetical protein
MPYLRCPSCGLLAHAVAAVAVDCPRCRALQRPVELQPLGRSVQQVDASLTHQPGPARQLPTATLAGPPGRPLGWRWARDVSKVSVAERRWTRGLA